MAKVTQAMVHAAQQKVERAEMAIERHQMRKGYARGDGKTMELRGRLQAACLAADNLKFQYQLQQKQALG